jgi:hypothetical protein
MKSSLVFSLSPIVENRSQLGFPLALGVARIVILVVVAFKVGHILVFIVVFVVVVTCAHTFHAWHVTACASAASQFAEVDAAEAAVLAHAAAELVQVVVFRRFVLFVFVNPLLSISVLRLA